MGSLKIAQQYAEDPFIRKLRVQTWCRAVEAVSRKTLVELEREFSNTKFPERRPPRSCIWEKYRRGLVVPRSGRFNDLASRVERRYPETAKWLSLTLWRLADKAPMQMDELRQVYEGMPKTIGVIFVGRPQEANGIFWRRPLDPQVACDTVTLLTKAETVEEARGVLRAVTDPEVLDDACSDYRRVTNIEALTAILAMVKEAEITQDQYQHYVATEIAEKYLFVMAGDPIVGDAAYQLRHHCLSPRWRDAGYWPLESQDPEGQVGIE